MGKLPVDDWTSSFKTAFQKNVTLCQFFIKLILFVLFTLSLLFLVLFFIYFITMCGISALILADSNGMACPDLFESLGLLQHRGQVKKKKRKKKIVGFQKRKTHVKWIGCCRYCYLCCQRSFLSM